MAKGQGLMAASDTNVEDGGIEALAARIAGLSALFAPPVVSLSAIAESGDAGPMAETAADAMAAPLQAVRQIEAEAARLTLSLDAATRALAVQSAPDPGYRWNERLVGLVSRRGRAIRQQRRLLKAAERDLLQRRAGVARLAQTGDRLAVVLAGFRDLLTPLHQAIEADLDRIVAARKAAFARFERESDPADAERLGRLEAATLIFQSFADLVNGGRRAAHALLAKLSADTEERLLLLAALTPESDDVPPPPLELDHFGAALRHQDRGMLSSEAVARRRSAADERFYRLFEQVLDKEAGRSRRRPAPAGVTAHA